MKLQKPIKVLLSLLLVLILGIALFYTILVRPLTPDITWSHKVRPNLNYEETRQWALNTRRFYSPTNDQRTFTDWLTNAPKLLLDNYRRPPVVIAELYDEETYYVSLRYGGGLVSWGITIGDTNLPPTHARGAHVQPWAPGIYFWQN